jgi:poly-gamma-glutamate synthesis protein (capsule biosynthesis protein)
MLARDIIRLMDENGSAFPYAAVQHLLEDADITIGNMEGTFTERGVRQDKFYTFRAPPRHAAGLAQAGFDVVSLGNNHAMDYGVVGLEDTIAALDAAGVHHSGAGLTAAEARKPAVLERNGLRLAFLSYNGAALSEATPAGPASPGVALAEVGAIQADVTAASAAADLVIVSIHAGVEYADTPAAQQHELANAAIGAGASLVLGHHAHVLQGWSQDIGAGAVVVYGLGNFVFDLDFQDLATLGPRPFLSVILTFELTRDGVESVTAHPVFIDPARNRPVPATGERLQEVEARIDQLNSALP